MVLGGDRYWAIPPFNKRERVEWLHSNPNLKLHFQPTSWDNLPMEVQQEYLLWLMSDRKDEYDKQVDKH